MFPFSKAYVLLHYFNFRIILRNWSLAEVKCLFFQFLAVSSRRCFKNIGNVALGLC